MRRTYTVSIRPASAAVASCLAALFILIGNKAYSASDLPAGKTPAKKTSTAAIPQATIKIPPPPTNIFLSTFSTENARDPFHPQIKPKAPAATVLAGPQGETEQAQVAGAVQAGFQGIYGTGDDRVVMVHGVLVPENRETPITVPINGQPRKLKVKALKISRNVAELQVEGLSQVITVPKAR
jgi:hypothetical protein